MPEGGNKMDTKSDEQFLVIEATIETNKQEADKNHKKTDDKLKLLTENHKKTNEKITLLTENLQVLTAMMIDKNKFFEILASVEQYINSHRTYHRGPD